MHQKTSIAVLALAAAAWLSACGGGGDSSTGPSPPPPTPAPSALSYLSPVTVIVNESMATLSPTISGSATSYSVSPALPAGISVNSSNGQISGTPTAVTPQANYAITASNLSGSASFTLSLTVSSVSPPSSLSYTTPITVVVGQAMAALTPTVNGTATTYAVVPAFPAGIIIDPASGTITGTPTTVTAQSTYTITAVNAGGSTAFALSLTVSPAPASPPSSLSYPSPVALIVAQAMTPISPTVTGAVLTYSVTPALPGGLNLNTTNGQISGTPAAVTAQATYTITASNAVGSTTFALAMAINPVPLSPPSGLSYPSPRVYTLGVPIATLVPSVTGTVTGYSVSPTLPAGLSINPSSGQISGTPTAISVSANYTVTASNSSGSTTFALIITVNIAPPSALSYPNPQSFTVGTAISALNPTVTGTVSGYAVAPSLPVGLALNSGTGQITGTPTAATAATNYTVTASNSSGSTSFVLNITVRIAAPSGLSYSSPQSYTVGTAIAPLNPTVTGTVTGYTVSPSLPAGLSLNGGSGQITGTPTAATPAANYTITASNSSGSTTFALNIVVTASTSAPGAPTVTAGYGLKRVILSWSAVSGATYYRILKNPDGASGFTQIGSNQTALSYDDALSVHLTDWMNARYIVEACNTVGCTGSLTTFAMDSARAIGYFKASDTETQDGFGNGVAISADGNTLAVGATGKDSNATGVDGMQGGNLNAAGAVYIFVRSGNNWSQQAFVKASNASVQTLATFGKALALSNDGNTLAVGADRENSAATGINGDQNSVAAALSGAVFVFTRSGSDWSQQAYVKASNTEAGDSFGFAVALSSDGNTMAVGAHGEDSSATGINGDQSADDDLDPLGSSYDEAGAVYLFFRSGGAWTQQAYIKASNTLGNQRFGDSLSLSGNGNLLAVGSQSESRNAAGVYDQINRVVYSGAVYTFIRSGSSWSQQQYIKASDTEYGLRFGYSVAISADASTLAVGATAGNATNWPSRAYVLTRSGGSWTEQAVLQASNHESTAAFTENFGNDIAISADGNLLAVSANYETSNAIGIEGDQTNRASLGAGAVYIFERAGTSWLQSAYVKASNTKAQNSGTFEGDLFGFDGSLSLSGDGQILAVGGFGEDSNAVGIGGNQADNVRIDSGAVYVY